MLRRTALLLLLVSATTSAGPTFPKKLISVKMKDAQASAFFRVIAEKIDANLVVADCADRKKLTVDVRNVQIHDVVRLVVLQYNLDVTYDGATLEVTCAGP